MRIKNKIVFFALLVSLSFLFLLCPTVQSFDIDGFKSGMAKGEVKKLLEGVGSSEKFIETDDYIYTLYRDGKRNNYGLFFRNEILYKIEIYLEPSLKIFMFWFRHFPEQIARRLYDYIQQKSFSPEDRIFPICYSTARALISKLGARLNVDLTPHDLRRYSATHASRNGVPLEIISKVILRHQDLKTTQVYLGKVTESEAIRWMDILNGR